MSVTITHSTRLSVLTGTTTLKHPRGKHIHIKLNKDFVITAADQYFIIGQNNVTIEGSCREIAVSYTGDDYPGLVQNGNNGMLPLPGYNCVTIKNIKIASSSTATLGDNAGWVCQRYFGINSKDCKVIKCVNNKEVAGDNAGGIVGADAAMLDVYECENNAIVSGVGAGGIVGANANSVTAYSCKNTGELTGANTGGVFGEAAIACLALRCRNYGKATTANWDGISNYNSGCIFAVAARNCKAELCKNKGQLNRGANGIFGHSAENCEALKCYNAGALGRWCNGIFGSGALECTAEACYNTGDMSAADAGGIFGDARECTARNCYNSGALFAGSYGIFRDGYANKIKHCYVSSLKIGAQNALDDHSYTTNFENYEVVKSSGDRESTGYWKNRSADKYLLGTNGSVWVHGSRNRPYKLKY